jgi:ubiquinone/menaquinone biosynthesis C-methylase UbiE
MDIFSYNREAWNNEVAKGNLWTIPVTHEQVQVARSGTIQILLTPTKFVPEEWWGDIRGKEVLCLASGGGQQGPLLAAVGARVTVFDQSPAQLAQDEMVARREGLDIRLVEGNMQDLSCFGDDCFDMIVHPVSNVFTPDVIAVWKEAYRVLRTEGRLLSGFNNPATYLFNFDALENGQMIVEHPLPYSDCDDLSEEELTKYMENMEPLEFSHTLSEQIGGQLAAGFILAGFYEDIDPSSIISKYFPEFIATLAIKR